MKDLFRRYQGPALVLLLLALPLYTLAASGGTRARLGTLDRAGVRTLGMLQSQADGVVGRIGGFWDDYIDLVDVKRENERLHQENARLREENTRLQGILQENARLSRLVGFREARPTLELVPARVIAADLSPYFRVLRLRIDVGSDRVEPGMPVVAAEGLVGQIESVAGGYSDVILTADPRSRVDILTQTNRARGVLKGLGRDTDYLAEIGFLARLDEVEVGDLVVTSGRGGRYPKELLVGRVSEVIKAESGQHQQVLVEPAVDFSRLEEVYIIVDDGTGSAGGGGPGSEGAASPR